MSYRFEKHSSEKNEDLGVVGFGYRTTGILTAANRGGSYYSGLNFSFLWKALQINLKLKHLLHETGPNNKLKPNNLIKTLLDFDKTIECYQKHGLIKQWEQLPDNNRHNKEKTFLEKIKSKRTGEYYQAEDLIKRELVPAGWQPPHIDIKTGKPLKYPIKHVNEIIRKRLADGSEWLLSREMWTGLDQAGNPISVSFNDKQWFDAVFPYT